MVKTFVGVVTLWLLCGGVAAYIAESHRPFTKSDIALGPISLVNDLRG